MAEPQRAVLRPATTDDLPLIVAMRDDLNALELVGSPHAPIQTFNVEEFAALWGATLSDANHCWRMVEVDGKVVGYGLIYLQEVETPHPGAFIHWAYLDAQHRRQGLGELLFEHLEAWARSRGANRIQLQFIDGNDSAERFWKRMGFEPYARKCVRYL